MIDVVRGVAIFSLSHLIYFLIQVQEYCYDNMNFMKLFQKMVTLLYKLDVISEDVIIMWYKTGHIPKGNENPS